MEKIIKFKTNGILFDDEKRCLEYEEYFNKCNELLNTLNPSNHISSNAINVYEAEYVQQNIQDIINLQIKVLNLIKNYYPDLKSTCENLLKDTNTNISGSILGRILSDYDKCPFDKIMRRLRCINIRTGKEYGQPYFAINS